MPIQAGWRSRPKTETLPGTAKRMLDDLEQLHVFLGDLPHVVLLPVRQRIEGHELHRGIIA